MTVEALRTFFRKLNLQNHILLITLSILIFWGIFFFISFRWFLFDLFSRQVSDQYRTFTKFVAQSMGPLISEGDPERIVLLAREVMEGDEHVEYIFVFDEKGNPLVREVRETKKDFRQLSSLVEGDMSENSESPFGSGREIEKANSILSLITYKGKKVGSIQLKVSKDAYLKYLERIQSIIFLSLGGLIFLSCIFVLKFSNDMTKPVVRLTQLADEISQGNLDVNIDFGKHVNCWEIKHCRQTDCAAYKNREVQCWFVDGTPCEGYEPRFPQKLGQCKQCEVYQAHRGDEIVQLADSFKHMAYKLKTSQKNLRGAYNLQKCLIQSSFDGIIASDVNGVILIFNRVAEHLTGFKEEEVVGKKTWRNFFYPDLLQEIHKPLLDDGSTVLQGFAPRESVIFRRDGELIPVLIGGVSLMHKDQDVGRVVFFYDIREIKRLRMDLIQSERMAAVGQTVASISHSIKNILDGLRGGVYIYNKGEKDNDLVKKKAGWDMIEKNIDIISELVIDLLNYSKERKLDFQKYSPNKLIEEVCLVMQRKAENKKIQLICEGDGQMKEAVFDPFAMHQCLLNLVSNAVDAIPPGRAGRVVVMTFRDKENNLCFKVSDNGTGISREIKEKILKGMFSTKGSKGTGLGLLVVQKIIKEHQGKLEITSEEGKGSEFAILLPYPAFVHPGADQGSGRDKMFSGT